MSYGNGLGYISLHNSANPVPSQMQSIAAIKSGSLEEQATLDWSVAPLADQAALPPTALAGRSGASASSFTRHRRSRQANGAEAPVSSALRRPM